MGLELFILFMNVSISGSAKKCETIGKSIIERKKHDSCMANHRHDDRDHDDGSH